MGSKSSHSKAILHLINEGRTNGVENNLYTFGVDGTGFVGIELPLRVVPGSVLEALENTVVLLLDVFHTWSVLIQASVLWETLAEFRDFNLLFKEVLLVEEENNGSVKEELVAQNLLEYVQRLLKSVRL